MGDSNTKPLDERLDFIAKLCGKQTLCTLERALELFEKTKYTKEAMENISKRDDLNLEQACTVTYRAADKKRGTSEYDEIWNTFFGREDWKSLTIEEKFNFYGEARGIPIEGILKSDAWLNLSLKEAFEYLYKQKAWTAFCIPWPNPVLASFKEVWGARWRKTKKAWRLEQLKRVLEDAHEKDYGEDVVKSIKLLWGDDFEKAK